MSFRRLIRFGSIHPEDKVRQRLLVATISGGVSSAIIALPVGLLVGPREARDFFAGLLVVWIPQLWFVMSGFGFSRQPRPAALAMGKYALTGAGFALWFALGSDTNVLATIAGAVMAIGMVTTMTIVLSRTSTDGKR